jgi:hypothetical protein
MQFSHDNLQYTRIGKIDVWPLLRSTTVLSVKGLTDPNHEGSEIEKVEAKLGYRQAIGWEWKSDPLFRVRYRNGA